MKRFLRKYGSGTATLVFVGGALLGLYGLSYSEWALCLCGVMVLAIGVAVANLAGWAKL